MSPDYTVDDVAAAIVDGAGSMTTMKLQKLVFYAQAEHLVTYGKPLFLDQVEAWAQGPVVRWLYEKHRSQRSVSTWPTGDSSKLTRNAVSSIERTLARYGKLSAEQLSELTHREMPWRRTRGGLAETARSNRVIPQSFIETFYRSHGGLTSTARKDVVASTALEGVSPSPRAQRLAGEVLSGQIDPNEAVARLLGR